MAFRKTLTQRLFTFAASSSKPSPQTLIPPAFHVQTSQKLLPGRADSGDGRIFLRSFRSASVPPLPSELLSLPVGDRLIERLRGMNGDRIRLEGLAHPPRPQPRTAAARISVAEARKLLRVSKMEAAKTRLRRVSRSCVSFSEFVRICGEGTDDQDHAREIARALDEAGSVIVLGDLVFLRPDQVAKAIEKVIPASMLAPWATEDDPRREELEVMEKEKQEIDKESVASVQRELWCGLGFLVVQTIGFARLTFWELSWDVMEPICFYVTSVYFMAGYAFFLRTSRDPSFEGFFESRFEAKQRKLMRARGFDVERLDELRRLFGCSSSKPCRTAAATTLLGAAYL
ncbi:hypothetical protein QJS10_CPA05g01587 [Acorus calamus]|uniref:Calcium uniporter protein C-terminal domain-containing protein n=1 Tax=Acorus calamus TaxID=4465 RepID=A0AAV9EQ53_ACOCL|nr:hypothetical protein QJS10_CPA05g01587 [Acorus calamus]